jgi:hypothetical protein
LFRLGAAAPALQCDAGTIQAVRKIIILQRGLDRLERTGSLQ